MRIELNYNISKNFNSIIQTVAESVYISNIDKGIVMGLNYSIFNSLEVSITSGDDNEQNHKNFMIISLLFKGEAGSKIAFQGRKELSISQQVNNQQNSPTKKMLDYLMSKYEEEIISTSCFEPPVQAPTKKI